MNFETRPVEELKRARQKSGVRSPVTLAFAELPSHLAMFIPCNGRVLARLQSSVSVNLRRAYPDRLVRANQDREKDGVWFWWEPKK